MSIEAAESTRAHGETQRRQLTQMVAAVKETQHGLIVGDARQRLLGTLYASCTATPLLVAFVSWRVQTALYVKELRERVSPIESRIAPPGDGAGDGVQRETVYEETLDPLAAAPVPPLGRLVGSRLEVLRSASGAPLTTLRHGGSSASAYTIDSARTSAADP